MVLYRQILKNAWLITWRHKKLWLLGFFVIWLGIGGEPWLVFKSYNFSKPGFLNKFWQNISASGLFTAEGFKNLVNYATNEPTSFLRILLIFLLILAVIILVIWLIIISQGALIYSVAHINAGKEYNLSSAWRFGTKKFWPILGLNFIKVAIAAFLFYLLRILAGGNTLLFIIVFDVAMLIMVVLSFIIKFSACGVILEGAGIFPAILKGLDLFKKNWPACIKLALLLFLINLAKVILDVLVTIYILVYFWLIIPFLIGSRFSFYLAIFLIPSIILIITSILATLYWSAWVLMFVSLVVKKD